MKEDQTNVEYIKDFPYVNGNLFNGKINFQNYQNNSSNDY